MEESDEEEARLLDDFMQTAHLSKLTVRRTAVRALPAPAFELCAAVLAAGNAAPSWWLRSYRLHVACSASLFSALGGGEGAALGRLRCLDRCSPLLASFSFFSFT